MLYIEHLNITSKYGFYFLATLPAETSIDLPKKQNETDFFNHDFADAADSIGPKAEPLKGHTFLGVIGNNKP